MNTYSNSAISRHGSLTAGSFAPCFIFQYFITRVSLQTIRYMIASLSLVAVFCIGSSMIVNASDKAIPTEKSRYYTSINIEEDDTLWDIEARYNSGQEDRNHYIHSIMELNNMTTDTLYSGQHLIIYYYSNDAALLKK